MNSDFMFWKIKIDKAEKLGPQIYFQLYCLISALKFVNTKYGKIKRVSQFK